MDEHDTGGDRQDLGRLLERESRRQRGRRVDVRPKLERLADEVR
jgi:hypothetical protein